MKKEEKLLDALGDVKSSYILECSQYVGNEQQDVMLLRPRKPRWANFSAVAAVMALFIAATLALLPHAQKEARTRSAASPGEIIFLPGGRALQITAETEPPAQEFAPVRRICVYEGDALLQTVDAAQLPAGEAGAVPGLFIGTDSGRPDYRDVNFDGYPDMGFPALGHRADNLPYCYFLWSPDSEQFGYGFTLLGGEALTLDGDSRQLVEAVSGESGVTLRRYDFADGALRPLEPVDGGDLQPRFQVSYDAARFALTSGDSGTFIAPLQGVGSYTPVCEIQIEFIPGLLPSAVAEQTGALLRQKGIDAMPQSKNWAQTILYARYGTQWDSRAEDIYFVSAGVRGTYRLTSRYFLEATEGYGTTFAEICSSFTCPLSESVNPEAERVAVSFADGFFGGSWPAMEPYLYDPNGEISHGDVYPGSASDIEIVELRGLEQLEERIAERGTGAVSLVFREGGEDSYTYLTMDMTKTAAGYKVSFFGLEK